jgi:DNA replication licensing factor MCM7
MVKRRVKVIIVKDTHGDDPKHPSNDSDDEENGHLNSSQTTTTNHHHKMVISPQVLREYIARARQHHPTVSSDVAPYIVEAYVSLRMEQKNESKRNQKKVNHSNHQSFQHKKYHTNNNKDYHANDQTVMTARQLLSILRLSQALARLRFSDYVAREDVDEAIRLTHMSKASLYAHLNDTNNSNNNNHDSNHHKKQKTEDTMSRIFHIIRDYYTQTKNTATTTMKDDSNQQQHQHGIDIKLCEAMILRKGFTQQQLFDCIQEYEELNVIQMNRSRTHIYFL